MKTCFKCSETKPLAEFYRHRAMSDGRLGKCKACTRTDVAKNRAAKVDYYREFDRKRGSRMTLADTRRYREENPEKYRAHTAVSNAVRDGRLVKPSCCSGCGAETRLHGHHDDYSRPLDVMWLCAACHKARHKELGWGYVANAIEG